MVSGEGVLGEALLINELHYRYKKYAYQDAFFPRNMDTVLLKLLYDRTLSRI